MANLSFNNRSGFPAVIVMCSGNIAHGSSFQWLNRTYLNKKKVMLRKNMLVKHL